MITQTDQDKLSDAGSLLRAYHALALGHSWRGRLVDDPQNAQDRVWFPADKDEVKRMRNAILDGMDDTYGHRKIT